MAIITITGNLAETPQPNSYGYFNFRIVEPTPPNHPRIKGDQAYDIEARPSFDKILPKLQAGSAVIALCEQRIDHFTTKTGFETSRPKNALIRIDFAPFDRRREHREEQMQELHQAAAEQGSTPHQQAKQNAYQPQEADYDYPF